MRGMSHLGAVVALATACVAADASGATVSGRVSNSNGTAIANVQVAFLVTSTQQLAASALTDAQGAYSVVVSPNTYDVRLTPPPESIFVTQTLPNRVISGDTTLNLVLVVQTSGTPASYDGNVVDRSGSPLPVGVNTSLCPQGGGTCQFDALDTQGNFAFAASVGTHRFGLTVNFASPPTNAPAYFDISRYVDLTADRTETVVLENRVVAGTVTDPNGNPIANASVGAWGYPSFANFGGYQSGSTTTNASGGFSLVLFPGSAQLDVIPPPGLGVDRTVTSITVAGDMNLSIVLPRTVAYRGHVVDRNGAPLPLGQYVQMCLSNGPCTGAGVDEQGDFVIDAQPGTYTLTLYGNFAPGEVVPTSYTLGRELVLTQDTNETLTLYNRSLTGTVRRADGTPVANTTLSLAFGSITFPGFTSGSLNTEFTTNGSGQYQAAVFPGTGTLAVTPPQGAGLGTVRLDLTISGDLALDVTLPAAVHYRGSVLDRYGQPLPSGQNIQLCSPLGICPSVTIDAQGAFDVEIAPGDYDVRLSAYFGTPPANAPLGYNLYAAIRTLTQDTTENVLLPAHQLSGTVVDPDGAAIANLPLSLSGAAGFGQYSGGQVTSDTTDANGDFAMAVLPGTITIQGSPAAASGLSPFAIQSLAVSSDFTLGILLQFVTETVRQDSATGGFTTTTDGEGDGATPSDPIETSVTSPNAGTVTITESPVSLTPPGRYRFLTQQIEISAPPASPNDPLVLVFTLDASRVPAGQTETTIQISKDGYPVKNCTGSPGVAFPDPCVSSRVRLADGDIQLTVLSSRASAWNFGISSQPCVSDGDCTDGAACTEDVCVNGFCALVPDHAACSDGQACTGIEICLPDLGCQAGSPPQCTDDGNSCTEDVCDPATGTCGVLIPCPDDGNACTSPVCDAIYACFNPVSGPCDDADACTTGDQCAWTTCLGTLATFDDAQCELDQFLATPLCTEPLSSRILEAFGRRITRAKNRMVRAGLATDTTVANRHIFGAQRALGGISRKYFRLLGRGLISYECFYAIDMRLNRLRGLLYGLVR